MKPCKDITSNIPVNVKIAESQDEYITLNAHKVKGPEGLMVFAIELSEKEITEVAKAGRLYIGMLTFNMPMQPIIICSNDKDAESIVKQYREGSK